MALTDIDGGRLADDAFSLGKNLIINGAMQVAQRGTSTTGLGATNSVFSSVDRFKHFTGNTAGRFTAEQIAVTDLPGFTKAFKLSCTTADTSITNNEYMGINHLIEGQNLQHLKKGTSSAEATMLSFYVKGNASATYTIEISDLDNGRHNTRTFDVTTSWTKIEVPFAGDTTGSLDNDNGVGFQISWWLHAGSDYTSGTFDNTNTWASRTNANRVSSSNTSFFDSTDRTFFLTGVQLEVGSVATPFEHRSYGDELAKCKRYYERRYINSNGNTDGVFGLANSMTTTASTLIYWFETEKRANPSVNLVLDGGVLYQRQANGSSVATTQSVTITSVDTKHARMSFAGSSFTAGGIGQIRVDQAGSGNAYFNIEAEL